MLRKYNEWKAQPWTNGSYLTICKFALAAYAIGLGIVAVYVKWEEIADKVSGVINKIKDLFTIRVTIHKD